MEIRHHTISFSYNHTIVNKNKSVHLDPQYISFHAGEQGALSKFAIKFFETMNSSLAANFLVLDFFGMITPRVYQAYNRNSEEIGHKNLAAASEEFTREIFTGPAIVLLPIAAAWGFGKSVGKSVNTSKNLLEEYTHILKSAINNNQLKESLYKRFNTLDLTKADHQALFKKELQQLMKENFYNTLIERSVPTDFIQRDKLVDKLKLSINQIDQGKVDILEHIVSNHNKLYGSFPERPFHINYPAQALKYKKQPDGDVGMLMRTAKNYVDDVVTKISHNMYHPDVNTMINHLQQKITAGRAATTLAGILAVGIALRLIPKYVAHMHKVYPGLYGIGGYRYNQGENPHADKNFNRMKEVSQHVNKT